MAKSRSAYVCSECGADFPRWMGKCPECGAWNSITEVKLPPKSKAAPGGDFSGFAGAAGEGETELLSEIPLAELPRFTTGFREFDRVLGGGIVPGAVVLIGGHPGAGKSTLLLETVCRLSGTKKVLYITGEESLQQVAMRAARLGLKTDQVRAAAETSAERVEGLVMKYRPEVLIIDSIQVMYDDAVSSVPGSVSQVRECAARFTRIAKKLAVATFMVGHVTKDGALAGPKVLEHCVDCSVMLEGGTDSRFRTLRCQKNRFGAVNEIGVFAMTDRGMLEVSNPSAIFLNRGEKEAPGSCVMVVWEGTRPLLVELQALVDETQLANPRRITVGTEQNRLAMLLAVLHRHAGVAMGGYDVFINVVGGVKVEETAADVPVVMSLLSSYRGSPIPKDMIAFGEIGLSGEVRPVPSGQERLAEAVKHGFRTAVVPKANAPRKPIEGLTVHAVSDISEIIELV